ncbi:MAG: glycosyltransferase [Planctomycetota bacterium]
MSLQNLLILSYYFPPQGGAGTQRFAKFAKYLPDYGYRPIILTADTSTTNDSAPHQDQTLMEEVGSETVIRRVKEDPVVSLPLKRKLGLALKFRIDAEEWVGCAMPIAGQLIKEFQPVALLTTVSPYAAVHLGRAISQRYDEIPWLLDLRDPWALDGWRVHHTPLHARTDRRLMQSALRDCDHIIANTPASGLAYSDLSHLPDGRVSVIPNGFDPDDFEHPIAGSGVDDHFEMIHVGTLHAIEHESKSSIKQSLRTSLRQINGLGRTAYYLLHALAKLKKTKPELYASFRLTLAGTVHPSNMELAERLGVLDPIRHVGYVSHRDALGMMQKADTVFVPLHGLPAGDPSLIVPGKLYEALASEQPVFACLPDGDAADLVRTADAGVVCPPDDIESITNQLAELLQKHRDGEQLRGARRVDLGMFTRRVLTQDLATTVRSVCAGGSDEKPRLNAWQKLTQAMHTDRELPA